jgi:acyl-CoA synthetase (AMP-forming)/AMP-acid ligase II
VSWIEVTTIGDVLLRAAERGPDDEALVFPERRVTYAELAEGSWRVARGLHALGVGRGDHVGILMPNCVEFVEALFGTALLGAVVCAVNVRYRAVELAYVVEHGDHAVLLTSDIVAEHVDLVGRLHEALPGLADAPATAPLELATAPRLRHVVVLGGAEAAGTIGRERFDALAGSVPQETVEPLRAKVRVRDVGLLLYTSGTTASPKGCLFSHEALVRGSRVAAQRWHVGRGDTTWTPLPLFHHGALQPLLYTLDVGGTFVTMTHFEPSDALRQLAAEQPTVITPTFLPVTMAIVNHPDFGQTDLSSIRVMLNVGPPDTLRQIQAAFPHAVQCQGTGLTEAGGQLAYGDLDADLEQRVTTIGRPLPGVELRIVDEGGRDVPAGGPGELLVRSFTLFEGYHKDPEQTAQVLDADGWLHTGDRFTRDVNGWVTFLGRIKEMLKVGGENVSPAEIESVVGTHPAVHLVQAVGVPDARLDEVPAVFVELKPSAQATEQELIEFCRGKIASFKVPRYVRFVDEWPMSATKIQRFRLRERLLAELGLDG